MALEDSDREALRHRLRSSTPESLPADVWAVVGDDAVGLVLATGATERSLPPLLSRLCAFLAAQLPELGTVGVASLLTDDRIGAYTPAGHALSRTSRARSDLRKLACAAGMRPVREYQQGHPPNRRAAAFWPTVAHFGPFTAAAVAYARWSGLAPLGGMWTGIDLAGPAKLVLMASVSAGGCGTVPDVLAAAREMRDAVEARPRRVSPTYAHRASAAAGRLTGPAPDKGRPLSRTAALKAAREAHARATTDPTGDVVVLAAAPDLPEDIAAAVDAYTPRGLCVDWSLVEEPV